MCAQLAQEYRFFIIITVQSDIVYVIKGEGKVVYSLVALFGLPRNKSAGKSFRQPIHGKLFFCDQDSVDEFVNNSQTIKISAKVAQILFQYQIFSFCMIYRSAVNF